MGFFSTWLQKLHETFIETQYWKLMLEGFGNTIVITLGALLIGVVESLAKAFGLADFSDVISFALLIIILVIKPTGLFGEKTTEKV